MDPKEKLRVREKFLKTKVKTNNVTSRSTTSSMLLEEA
jgi:hypothetical protein